MDAVKADISGTQESEVDRATSTMERVETNLHPTLRLVAMVVLLASTMLDRYTIEVMSATVKLEHIALVGIWLLLGFGGVRWGWRLNARPLVWLVPFAVVLFLSSLLNAPDRAASLRQAVMVILVASGAWSVYCLASTPSLLRKAVQMLWILGVVETASTFTVLAADRFGYTFGTQAGNGYSRVPFGTLWEPNVLGSYIAASAMLVLSALLAERKRRDALWLAACLSAMTAAVGLSLARASWLALVVGGLVVVLLYWRMARVGGSVLAGWSRNLRPTVAAGLLAIVFLVAVAPFLFPQTFRGIFVRVDFRWYSPSQDPALQERATQYTEALRGITGHPFIGNGAGSFGTNHAGEHGQPGWISNLELHLLYDSGLIGLFSVLGGLAALLWAAVKALRRAPPWDVDLRPQLIGLIAATLVLLITFQATDATWLAFTWPYVGLLTRAMKFSRDRS